MMTLKQLEAFYWICKLGGFGAAAQHLNTTQSAVSMRIQKMEQDLGVALFERSMRVPAATVKGRELLPYAEQMLQLSARISEVVANPTSVTLEVRIGVTELIAMSWLPDLIAALNRTYPKVSVAVDVDLTYNHLRKFEAGELTMALLPGPVNVVGTAQRPLGKVDLVWAASPNLRIPDRVFLVNELGEWPILVLDRASYLNTRILSAVGAGTRPKRLSTCNNMATLRAMAIAGIGIAVLPYDHFRQDFEAGRLRAIRCEPRLPHLDYFAIYDQRGLDPLVKVIADLACQTSTFDADITGA